MFAVLWILTLFEVEHHLAECTPCATPTLLAGKQPKSLTSPGYPQNYGARLSCSWKIQVTPEISDALIQIQIIDSSLEPATGCWRDSVEITDGSRDFHRSLVTWCGSSWPQDVLLSSGDIILVQFNTDFKENYHRGFHLQYWAVKKPLLLVHAPEKRIVNQVLFAVFGAIITSMVVTLLVISLIFCVRRNRKLRLIEMALSQSEEAVEEDDIPV